MNAHTWPHREIARYIHEKYKVPSWWTQTVTVGYERIKGLRERGQRRSGSWEASKSRTIDAAAGTLFRTFQQEKRRSAWLPGVRLVIRTAVPNKSLRITWDDGTSVEASFVPKGRSKAVVSVTHARLSSREDAARMKAFWDERLGALAEAVVTKT